MASGSDGLLHGGAAAGRAAATRSAAGRSAGRSVSSRAHAPDAASLRILACCASAALYAALFPPLVLGWLSPLALAPYLWAVAGQPVGRAAALGALWAMVATAGVAWWLPDMLAGYFGLPPGLGLLGLVGVGLLSVAPVQAAFAAWVAWRTRAAPIPPLAVGAAWALAEAARSHAPIANPVGLLAYGALDTPLAQLADVAGPFGLGALLAASAAAVAEPLRRDPGRAARTRAASSGRHDAARLAGAALALAAACAYGAWRLAAPPAAGEPVRVALVQAAVARPPGWDRAASGGHLARHLALTREAVGDAPALVLWPEFAVDFYLQEAGSKRSLLRRALAEHGAFLLTGASRYEVREGDVAYRNTVYLLGPDGDVLGRHDKTRLMPFAEYGPLGDTLRAETALYEPGDTLQPLEGPMARLGVLICGESLFPAVARRLAASGAELLVNPSNDHWFGTEAGAEQQLRAARLRAIENRRWLLRPTSTGYSAIVDAQGRVRSRSGFGTTEVLSAEVRRGHGRTPAQDLGEAPLALAGAMVVSSSVRGRRWRRPAGQGGTG